MWDEMTAAPQVDSIQQRNYETPPHYKVEEEFSH